MIGLSSTKSNEIEHRWACHPSNLKDETGKSGANPADMANDYECHYKSIFDGLLYTAEQM